MENFEKICSELGLGEAFARAGWSITDLDEEDLEDYRELYKANVEAMKPDFDDDFIVQMFMCFNSVFMRMPRDFCGMLGWIREELGTEMWPTLIQYEWSKTGESTVFDLMDDLSWEYFGNNLRRVCERVRGIWVDDYGDGGL